MPGLMIRAARRRSRSKDARFYDVFRYRLIGKISDGMTLPNKLVVLLHITPRLLICSACRCGNGMGSKSNFIEPPIGFFMIRFVVIGLDWIGLDWIGDDSVCDADGSDT